MGSYLQTEFSRGVGKITLNRPAKRNALNRELIRQLDAEITTLKSKGDLRALVITGSGSVFCAGMDLAEMQARAQSPDGPQEWKTDSEIFCRLLCNLFTVGVPTLIQLQGPVLAGGVGLVLAADFVIASKTASLSLPEPSRGIAAAMVTPLLFHRVGAGVAGQLLLSGEKMSAERAHQIGLCYDVVDSDRLEERVEKVVSSILTGSPSALAITKKHLNECSDLDVVEQIKRSIDRSAEARTSADAREGLAAFLEKRKPSWAPTP